MLFIRKVPKEKDLSSKKSFCLDEKSGRKGFTKEKDFDFFENF